MSEERKLRRRRQREARTAAIRAARAMGCTCDVQIEFGLRDHPLHGAVDDLTAVLVRHDDWCPLLRVMEERKPGRRGRSS